VNDIRLDFLLTSAAGRTRPHCLYYCYLPFLLPKTMPTTRYSEHLWAAAQTAGGR